MWLEKKKNNSLTSSVLHSSSSCSSPSSDISSLQQNDQTSIQDAIVEHWSFIIKGITNKCRWNSNYKLKQIFISIKGHADVSLIKWAAYIHEMSKLKLKKMILYQYIKGNTTAWVWSHHLVLEFCPNLLHFSAWQNNCRSLAGCTVEIWN